MRKKCRYLIFTLFAVAAFLCIAALSLPSYGNLEKNVSIPTRGDNNIILAQGQATPVICKDCGRAGWKDHCSMCGAWCPSTLRAPVMCNKCFNPREGQYHCLKCGTWCPTNNDRPTMCQDCFSYKGGKDHCIKCGRWCPK